MTLHAWCQLATFRANHPLRIAILSNQNQSKNQYTILSRGFLNKPLYKCKKISATCKICWGSSARSAANSNYYFIQNQMIMKKLLVLPILQLSVSELENGFYILKIDNGERLMSEKFLKMKE